MLPQPYNNNYQVLQTRDYVVIVAEMIHDARIIPLDGRAHLPSHLREWMGDPVGRWEGDTLVVETTNFTDKTSYRGAGEKPASGRALSAHSGRHPSLSGDHRRSDDLHAAVDD